MDKYTYTGVVLLLLLSCVCSIFGQSCEGKCGGSPGLCSCQPTCESLKNCCPDYRQYCVLNHPYSGTIFGGTDFVVLHTTFNKTDHIVCRFNYNTDTVGYVDENSRGHCISPLLYETGWIPFQISTNNGTTFTRAGRWLSVHTGKLDSKLKAVLVNATKWQYYGTPGVSGSLQMTWNTSMVKADKVNIELWGYRETGTAYTVNWEAEWKYLYTLAKGHSNHGTFSFEPQPAPQDFSSWELGMLRVTSSVYPDGMWNVEATWTEDHALAWHLDEKFRADSAAWAKEKCLTWDTYETKLPNFVQEIIDCPCTLAQARADTGRFHTDYGCDIEKGSVCTYHPGSVHCVRAIQASPQYAAGQQCCYDSSGDQVLTGDSIGGSTPDRAHDWGSPPYKRPPRVPGQSHWVYDVLSFYYCCLWSDNCSYYFKHRPSSGCVKYRTPRSAAVFGDPHFLTFDGLSYSFNGKGEYVLMSSKDKDLLIQGRTEPVNDTIKATKMTAVAMREGSSDVIEVRVVSEPNQSRLEVLQNQEKLSFSEQSWMDLHGVFVFSPSSTKVTVMFPSGTGVEVRLRGDNMATTVLLPEDFSHMTLGLMGKLNGNAQDDLTLENGQVVQNISNPEEVFSFGASWAIIPNSSLFTYDSTYLENEYKNAPKHDVSFFPDFYVTENASDPLLNQAIQICSGEGSQFCRYDVLVGRSLTLGNTTKMQFHSHVALVDDLKPVVSCGFLSPPTNGMKNGTTYLQGSKVFLSCGEGYTLGGSSERVCQPDGRWSGEDSVCAKPTNVAGIVAGSVIGGLALIAIITTIVLAARKNKRKAPAQANQVVISSDF
ncbi:sushi domain-containing protein 2-like [Eucyclogobius newberryi]|uniref:sushi domain-containing protein 2-like n=1 Tax=Eucyclogobius newberryi TaxID=166745 RepID=UPI003B58BB46